MNEAGFLAAIAATPEDAALRLVYADWLEDRGDVRAELVRAMERMQRLTADSDEYWELRTRRDELRPAAKKPWLEKMGYGAYRPLFTRLPIQRERRWALMADFLEAWHKPLGARSGDSEESILLAESLLHVRLPAAMREWYALAGKRTGIWSAQDHWLPLAFLTVEPNVYLEFRVENQSCARWGIQWTELGFEDPPVVRTDVEGFPQECPSFSEFVLLNLCLESIWQRQVLAICHAGGNDAALRTELARQFIEADLPHQYWEFTPMSIWEANDLVCFDSRANGYVWIAARSLRAFEALSESFRAHFEVQVTDE